MDMSLENQHLYSRESKLLNNHEIHEDHEGKAQFSNVFVSSMSFVVIFESLRAFFEGGWFAA
jgi:hypothetical protein